MSEANTEEDYFSPYCVMCGACGEEGCCPPTICKQMNGEYCDYYLKVLKATYVAHTKMFEELPEELQNKAIDKYFEEYKK